jgi:hypothetical protein
VDPDSLNPAFQVIRIQGFDDQKLKKKYMVQQKFLKIFFRTKVAIHLCPKLQKKPSALKREHPAFQKMKFINFFLCLWVIYVLLDPDRDSQSGSGYGFKDPIQSASPALFVRSPS